MALALVPSCETQPYPRQAASSAEAAVAAAPEAPEGSPVIDESETFLAVRELAQRGPTRDLRAAAFRYLDLRFSSGTLGAGQTEGSSASLSDPVRVTAEDQALALEAVVEALRALPPGTSREGSTCFEPFDRCLAAPPPSGKGDCGDRLLVCAAGDLPLAEPEG